MHELAVTQSILEIALRHAERASARRILSINLVIGELTGFVDDSIQFQGHTRPRCPAEY